MDNLYERIEKLGQLHGYSNMTILCKAAMVPRAVMSELKAGRTNELSMKNAIKFAEFLDVSVGEILGEDQKEKPDAKSVELTDNEIKLIMILRQLSPEALALVEDMALKLKKMQ